MSFQSRDELVEMMTTFDVKVRSRTPDHPFVKIVAKGDYVLAKYIMEQTDINPFKLGYSDGCVHMDEDLFYATLLDVSVKEDGARFALNMGCSVYDLKLEALTDNPVLLKELIDQGLKPLTIHTEEYEPGLMNIILTKTIDAHADLSRYQSYLEVIRSLTSNHCNIGIDEEVCDTMYNVTCDILDDFLECGVSLENYHKYNNIFYCHWFRNSEANIKVIEWFFNKYFLDMHSVYVDRQGVLCNILNSFIKNEDHDGFVYFHKTYNINILTSAFQHAKELTTFKYIYERVSGFKTTEFMLHKCNSLQTINWWMDHDLDIDEKILHLILKKTSQLMNYTDHILITLSDDECDMVDVVDNIVNLVSNKKVLTYWREDTHIGNIVKKRLDNIQCAKVKKTTCYN